MLAGEQRPPATTVLPAALHRAISACADSRCAIIPLTKTRSAHCRCFGVSLRTFQIHQPFSQARGSMAATVSRPSGGKDAFFQTNFSACLKLQMCPETQDKAEYVHITDYIYARYGRSGVRS